MEIQISDLVEAKAGRDKGKLFFVVAKEGEYVFIVDGKTRKVEKPKRKKIRHIQFVAHCDLRVATKINTNEKVSNSEIRRTISAMADEIQA